jgi:hypothetical protein
MPRIRHLGVFVLALAAVSRSAPGAPSAPVRWEWTVRPAADFSRLDVRLCFESFRPKRLTLRVPSGAALTPAPAAAGRYGLTADAEGYVPVEAGGSDPGAACLEYALDVTALAKVREAHTERSGARLLGDPRAWLLAPALWPPEVEARVRIVLPEGQQASVPWEPLETGLWRLPATALIGQSVVVLGAFTTRSLDVGGTRLHVSVLDGAVRATAAGIDRWLGAAVNANAALYGGRFPMPRIQVVVEPARSGGEPVNFGQAHLSGGAAVHLLLGDGARDEDLPGEWVTFHEFTHLAMPWIDPADAWFSEGFVTYYQEVLRARAGFLTPEAFWQSVEEGFGRGRKSGGGLALGEESRQMGQHRTYHRVYWAGAALALRLDLALRAATAGKRSLDDLMRLISEPTYTQRLGWRATELLAAGDQAFGTRVLAPGVAAALAASDFPAVDDLYAALGVRVEGGKVRLSDDPAQRTLREGIHGKR